MHQKDSRASTDVTEFISDLEAGQFEQMLSVALSQVAAAVVDREKKGSVEIKLNFEHIKGTQQVRLAHVVTFKRPTMSGKATEDSAGATVLHVSKGGRLSLAQPDLLAKSKQTELPGT